MNLPRVPISRRRLPAVLLFTGLLLGASSGRSRRFLRKRFVEVPGREPGVKAIERVPWPPRCGVIEAQRAARAAGPQIEEWSERRRRAQNFCPRPQAPRRRGSFGRGDRRWTIELQAGRGATAA
jgi:hypothetical protein